MTKEKLLTGKQILIVDDEPDILETLKELLHMCKITEATTFEQAENHLKTHYFDLAILDIMGVDGYKLLEIANEREVIAVMLTAHALSPENLVKSYEEGAASYLPKEKIESIALFLEDILEAKEKGKSLWWRWFDRLGSFFERKFGSDWQERDKDFWSKFPYST